MPTVHGLEFAYSLYPLPPGRMPFRRWRWELWHGSQLVAAGWRLGRADAAARCGCTPPITATGCSACRPRRAIRARAAAISPGHHRAARDRPITALLVPRALERPAVSAPVL